MKKPSLSSRENRDAENKERVWTEESMRENEDVTVYNSKSETTASEIQNSEYRDSQELPDDYTRKETISEFQKSDISKSSSSKSETQPLLSQSQLNDLISEKSSGRDVSKTNLPEDGEGEGGDRDRWGSNLQFILTCVGYAVGLGNIWRFPALAYENGGGAFLIPYITCSLLFGLPLLYFEFCIGQYLQSGPSVVFYKFMPALQGIGWGMALVAASVGIYYNVIIAWVGIYLFQIVSGQSSNWVRCNNPWNTEFCQSTIENDLCYRTNSSTPFYYNGHCYETKQLMRNNLTSINPAEEFFENYVLEKSPSIDDLGGFNSKLLISLGIMWSVIAVGLWKGVKYIGKISLFTATVPYVIIAILFVRGITLDGARLGIDYYMLKPNFSIIYNYKTWQAALTQVCFSLSIGFGGLLSMASYNQVDHDCLKDALIVVAADSMMSIFGGTAVFCTLGYLSKAQGVPLEELVQSGTALAFVVYPEAMGRMPVPWLWSFLFFFMLFLLGLSTQFVYSETLATSLMDQFPKMAKYRVWFTSGTCVMMFGCGLVMTTRGGIYWFNIFNEYTGSFSVCVVVVAEVILVIYIYGSKEFMNDLRSMFGFPTTTIGRIIGRSGVYFKYNWMIISPILGTAVLVFTCLREPMTYGKGARMYTYPAWSERAGWLIGIVPSLSIPIFFLGNTIVFAFRKKLKDAFKIHPSHRSFGRIREVVSTCREPVEEDESYLAPRNVSSMLYSVGSIKKHHLDGERETRRDTMKSERTQSSRL